VLALQREQDVPNRRSDREYHAPATLPCTDDLPSTEVYFGPPQRHALLQPHAAGADKVEERTVVGAHSRVQRGRLFAVELAHTLLRLGQQQLIPFWLALKNRALGLGEGEHPLQNLGSGPVHGGVGNHRQRLPFLFGPLAATRDTMSATPRNELLGLIVVDIGERLLRAEVFNEPHKVSLSCLRICVVLRLIIPEAIGHIVNRKRRAGTLHRLHQRFGSL
jgi:hypothetical protein